MPITITQPITTLTNCIIAVETLIFAWLLFRVYQARQQTSIAFWAAGFLCIAVAAILAGAEHGLTLYIDKETKLMLSMFGVFALSLFSCLMLQGTVISSLNHRWHKFLFVVISLKAIIYLYLSATKDDYRYVIADYLSAIVAIFILQCWKLYRHQERSAIWIILGTIASVIAAGVQQSGWKIAEHFNHNDLYHIISMVAFYFGYQGSRLFKDR